MNQFLKDAKRGVEGSAQDAAQKVLWRLFLEISVGLIGLAGLGFITASAFLALSASLGAAWAALLTGLGLLLAAGGFVAIVKRPWSKQHLANAPIAPPIPLGDESRRRRGYSCFYCSLCPCQIFRRRQAGLI